VPDRHDQTGHDQDGVARRARAQQVALFRYRLICPALEPDLSCKARGRVVRAIAADTHDGPFGGQVCYSRDTLDRWIRRYRAGGLDALAPSLRQPGSRIEGTALELAAGLKRENPDRTAAQVARILRASAGWSPSESTLLRLFHRRDLMGPAAGDLPVVFGRFEAGAPNERWVGDALHGPRVGGRKTYLFAFLDDHSRLAVGYRFGFAEDTVRLAVALERALAARGVPGSCYVDNGSAFVDSWLLRACAKLGIRLIHSTPHRPQGRGKIERFFRTVREQFLVEVADSTAHELAERGVTPAAALLELNAQFTAWVESVYHHRVHTETGHTPLQRWDTGWQAAGHGPAMASTDAVTEAFKWSHERIVTKTATVSLHGNTYQVEAVLVGRKVELVFSPFDLENIEVRYRDKSYGRAVPHRITRHTHPKARPETPEPTPPPPTGIAYLHLVTDAHHQQLAADERIGFQALFSTGPQPPETQPSELSGPRPAPEDGQLPGQLSIDDALNDALNGEALDALDDVVGAQACEQDRETRA
jgi:putative transposase